MATEAFRRKSGLCVKTVTASPPRRAMDPSNCDEARRLFLDHGVTPKFAVRGKRERVSARLASSILHAVSDEHLALATGILGAVKERFSDQDFGEAVLGAPISQDEASVFLQSYVASLKVTGKIRVRWTENIGVAGKIVCRGSKSDPHKRVHTIWAFNGPSSCLLREGGIRTFAAHELGTHLVRSANDRAQVWATSRSEFGLFRLGSRDSTRTEEGLASLSTALHQPADAQYLFSAALLYYAAAKGQQLNFEELFNDLGRFVRSEKTRFAAVMRVKKGVEDNALPGSSGQTQVYLEGAVALLRELDSLCFRTLFSGKIAQEHVERVKRLVRPGTVSLPPFAQDLATYTRRLRAIGVLNGILEPLTAPQRALRQRPKTTRPPFCSSTSTRSPSASSSPWASSSSARSPSRSALARRASSPSRLAAASAVEGKEGKEGKEALFKRVPVPRPKTTPRPRSTVPGETPGCLAPVRRLSKRMQEALEAAELVPVYQNLG